MVVFARMLIASRSMFWYGCATYRLEDGNLAALKVVVGLNILAIVAVDIRQL
jgi:hypothetical protein